MKAGDPGRQVCRCPSRDGELRKLCLLGAGFFTLFGLALLGSGAATMNGDALLFGAGCLAIGACPAGYLLYRRSWGLTVGQDGVSVRTFWGKQAFRDEQIDGFTCSAIDGHVNGSRQISYEARFDLKPSGRAVTFRSLSTSPLRQFDRCRDVLAGRLSPRLLDEVHTRGHADWTPGLRLSRRGLSYRRNIIGQQYESSGNGTAVSFEQIDLDRTGLAGDEFRLFLLGAEGPCFRCSCAQRNFFPGYLAFRTLLAEAGLTSPAPTPTAPAAAETPMPPTGAGEGAAGPWSIRVQGLKKIGAAAVLLMIAAALLVGFATLSEGSTSDGPTYLVSVATTVCISALVPFLVGLFQLLTGRNWVDAPEVVRLLFLVGVVPVCFLGLLVGGITAYKLCTDWVRGEPPAAARRGD